MISGSVHCCRCKSRMISGRVHCCRCKPKMFFSSCFFKYSSYQEIFQAHTEESG
jgi:hypothetical protein